MSTIWGPALDAEVAYRQERVRAAFGRPARTDRQPDRREDRQPDRREDRQSGRREDTAGQAARIEGAVHRRAERIRAGLAGMRPRPATGRRFA